MKKIILFLGLTFSLLAKTQTIVFGAGYFWSVEKHFEKLHGVSNVVSGYSGGDYANPTYQKVLKYKNSTQKITNHTEAVEIVYDDTQISTTQLIKSFWELHDPTQGNRQGNDIGNNYRSAIYFTSPQQKRIALNTQKKYQLLLKEAGYGSITTEIKALERFYKAKEYHQDYLKRNPSGYCPNHSTGVKFTKEKTTLKKITPLGDKEIIVIDTLHCRFCEKFKSDVTDKYLGTITLRTAKQHQLKGFKISTKIKGTPTILFIDNAKEIHSHTGYMGERRFCINATVLEFYPREN